MKNLNYFFNPMNLESFIKKVKELQNKSNPDEKILILSRAIWVILETEFSKIEPKPVRKIKKVYVKNDYIRKFFATAKYQETFDSIDILIIP